MSGIALAICLSACRVGFPRGRARSEPHEPHTNAVTINANGEVVGNARDGYYALYRKRKYRGDVERSGEFLKPMYSFVDIEPGDVLAETEHRRFVETGVDFVTTRFNDNSKQRWMAGAGLHLRYYSLAGGLQLGVQAAAVTPLRPGAASSVVFVTPQLGWGVSIGHGLVLSANVGVGRAMVLYSFDGSRDYEVNFVEPSFRLQASLTTWLYATLDAGVAIFEYGGRVDDFGILIPYEVRAPISRITAGFDL